MVRGDNWIAATMSNFGIVINKDRIAELGLATPVRWADIAGPSWFGYLTLADPSKSGSVRSGYEMIFQQYGWAKGWGLLTLMFANAGELRDVGSTPADDVGSAQALAGIVIDFFGRKQMLRVGPSLVGFVVPEGGSTIDPDPIAVLKGAPHAELAAHFVEFVISPEGQRLWVFRAGTPGGPQRTALGRMAVLPALYSGIAVHAGSGRSVYGGGTFEGKWTGEKSTDGFSRRFGEVYDGGQLCGAGEGTGGGEGGGGSGGLAGEIWRVAVVSDVDAGRRHPCGVGKKNNQRESGRSGGDERRF